MSSLLITTIQTSLFWENKEANRQMLEEKIRNIKEKTQVVVLPEMFSTGFSMNPQLLAESMSGPTMEWMKKVAAERKVILTGSIIVEEDGNYYNRAVWMLPNGEFGFYDKRHLFAFAGEDKQYKPGKKRSIVSVNGWKINLIVCYDLRFPVWARQQYNSQGFEYDVLICVANWPQKRSHAWTTLLTARAIENQCYVVGVNRVGNDGNGIYHSGGSMVIDPLGTVLYQGDEREEINPIELNKKGLMEVRERLPFWKEADGFDIFS